MKKKKIKTVGFVSGNFNVLHPGHLRLFKFAKENASHLIVAVTEDIAQGVSVPQKLRAEALRELRLIDEVIEIKEPLRNLIKRLSPDIVVKGKEFEQLQNEESAIVQECGAKLIFSSGDTTFSASDLIKKEGTRDNWSAKKDLRKFMGRHDITAKSLLNSLSNLPDLRVLVIGDLIVDRYVFCDPIGMSQEDPTVVIKKNYSRKYIGGAGIVASHCAKLGCQVSYIGLVGEDENASFAKASLQEYGVSPLLVVDTTRPTSQKTRYRAGNKTMLRVNDLREHDVSGPALKKLFTQLDDSVDQADVIILSDFSYGLLTRQTVSKIMEYSPSKQRFWSADSQSSSQNGDLTKFFNMDLITPTEREARLTVGDHNISITQLPIKLRSKIAAKQIVITMGSDGILVSSGEFSNGFTDRLPAFEANPIDVAGAGDSFFAWASLCMASGMSVWESSLCGSIASAIQVSQIGNEPIERSRVEKKISEILI